MACLREQAPDGRVGVISCDEEGCLFRRITNRGGTITADDTSASDCVLQLRLRAGDSEDSIASESVGERRVDSGSEAEAGQSETREGRSYEQVVSDEVKRAVSTPRKHGLGLSPESGGTEGERPVVSRVSRYEIQIDNVTD